MTSRELEAIRQDFMASHPDLLLSHIRILNEFSGYLLTRIRMEEPIEECLYPECRSGEPLFSELIADAKDAEDALYNDEHGK